MARSRTLFAVLIAAALMAAASTDPARAENPGAPTEPLYRSTFVVTGSDTRNRKFGITQCFAQMLVKLTGGPAIVDDPRFAGFAAQATSYVQSFSYRDRLFGRPVHDEQGTYDRPHNLTVAFVPDKIDAVVRALGRAPWLAPRPRVVVFLGVENFKATFMLTRDSTVDRSADMRSVFAAAAERVGLSVAFPAQAELEARGFTAKTLPDAPLAKSRGARRFRRRRAARPHRVQRRSARLDRHLAPGAGRPALSMGRARRQFRRSLPQRAVRRGADFVGPRAAEVGRAGGYSAGGFVPRRLLQRQHHRPGHRIGDAKSAAQVLQRVAERVRAS